MRRAVGRPSPVPRCFVVKNGSNTRSPSCAGNPGRDRDVRLRRPAGRCHPTSMRPAWFMACAALISRLVTTTQLIDVALDRRIGVPVNLDLDVAHRRIQLRGALRSARNDATSCRCLQLADARKRQQIVHHRVERVDARDDVTDELPAVTASGGARPAIAGRFGCPPAGCAPHARRPPPSRRAWSAPPARAAAALPLALRDVVADRRVLPGFAVLVEKRHNRRVTQ